MGKLGESGRLSTGNTTVGPIGAVEGSDHKHVGNFFFFSVAIDLSET